MGEPTVGGESRGRVRRGTRQRKRGAFDTAPAERSGRGGGPGGDDHGESLAGADRGHLADGEAEVGGQGESEAGEDERGDRADLELAEAHADARARASAEGDVGAAGERGLGLGGEALGMEASGSANTSGRWWEAQEQ